MNYMKAKSLKAGDKVSACHPDSGKIETVTIENIDEDDRGLNITVKEWPGKWLTECDLNDSF